MTAQAGDIILTSDAQITVITGTATRANNAFSTSAEATAMTANEHPYGEATLSCSFAIAPVAGSSVHLFRRDLNIDGTNDAPVPNASYEEQYVGSFALNTVTTQQFSIIATVPLRNGDQEFYIKNGGGQVMDLDYVVKIKSVTHRVKA